MTKAELDKHARDILTNDVPRNLRNNRILAKVEDLAEIFALNLRKVQDLYGHWDTYTLEVVGETPNGYLLRFTHDRDGRIIKMEFDKPKRNN